LTNPLRLQ